MSTYQAIKVDGVPELMERLDIVAGLATHHGKHDRFTRQLFEQLGDMVEHQTKRRIANEKESPDGRPWPEWSKKYGAKRESHHSLLESSGDLLFAIDYQVDRTRQRVEIGDVKSGSNLVYLATHQFGDPKRNIPARPFLGISAKNERELLVLVDNWLARTLRSH